MSLKYFKKHITYFMLFFIAKTSFALESLSYSGRLVQTNGAPVTGTVNLRAELVYTNNTSVVLCSDDISGVVLSKGVFHVKLEFACTGGKTLTQVLSQAPAGESVAIQITDVTNSKSYSFQALHALPYANVASQLVQMGAGDGEFLKWDNTTKQWKPGTVSGASGGTVTSVSVSAPLSIATPTSTPSITLPQADGSTSGYLSAADWNTFNSKEGTIAGGTATQYYRGDKSWQTLDTSAVPENVNLYFTNARALGVPLTGFVTAAGAIVATDTTLQAFGKTQGQINAINTAATNYLIKNSTDSVTGVVNVGTTGLLQLVYVPVGLNDATNKAYVDSEVGNKVSKAGDTVTGVLTFDNDLRIKGGSNYVTVKGHATSANYNLTLPQTAGTAGYVLATDGSGNTSWVTSAVGSSSITDGSIVDADVNATAGIAQSKIANLTTDLAGKVSTTLTSGNIFVGNGSNVATGVAVSGDATLSNAGVLTLANTAVTAGTYKSVTVDAKGRVTGGTNPTTLVGYGITDTLVNSITVTAPITKTGTAAVPILAMPAATTSVDGYLSSTDWTTFNNKQSAITTATNLATGAVTTSLQNGVNLNPFGVAAGNTGELRFYELAAGGTNYTSLKAPDALGSNINYVLPSAAPTAGQVLSSTAGGVMSWVSIPSAPVTTVFGRSGAVTATAGDYTASQITYSPAGNIAATTVQAALDEIDSEKQSLITAGTTSQYYRGDKTFVDFGTDVRSTALTGFAVGANSAVVATDTTLAAFGKVQGQINATNTAVAGKEPTIPTGTTAQYIRGDKTLSTFATDAINSVLSTFALNGTSKPSVTTADSVVGAFGKVQKYLNDINSDYVSKSANQTINGTLAINSATGFITVPTPINPNDAANKSYVDGFGQWTKTGSDIYRSSGNVGIGTTVPDFTLDVPGSFRAAGTARVTLARTMTNVLGDTVALGSLSNNGKATWARIRLNAHNGGNIDAVIFEVYLPAYQHIATTTGWQELPTLVGSSGWQGNVAYIVDVYRQDPLNSAAPFFFRVRNRNGTGNGALDVVFEYDDHATFTAFTTASNVATAFNSVSAPAGGPIDGFYGGWAYSFPVSQGHAWNASTGAGLFIKNSGFVGIGTSTPTNTLNVSNNAAFNPAANVNSAIMVGPPGGVAYGGGVLMKDGTNYAGMWTNGSGTGLVLAAGGTTGGFPASNQITISAGNISAPGCVSYNGGTSGTCLSDRRLKKDIKPFKLGLNKLIEINPVSYKYNGLGENKADDNDRLGVIAQDVEKVAPELVERRMVYMHEGDKEKTEVRAVNYNSFTYMLINSIKELYGKWNVDHEQIENQKREIASLKSENEELKLRALKNEKENAEIKKRLDRLEKALK